jgi:hypothetical protein
VNPLFLQSICYINDPPHLMHKWCAAGAEWSRTAWLCLRTERTSPPRRACTAFRPTEAQHQVRSVTAQYSTVKYSTHDKIDNNSISYMMI